MAFEVRAATDSDTDDVAQLIREMIPGVSADARLAWMHYANPAGRALTWIASEDGELAGCTSYFPWRLVLDGTPVLGALGGDGYVRPIYEWVDSPPTDTPPPRPLPKPQDPPAPKSAL